MGRVFIGVDGSSAADRALRWGVTEARMRDADVELVHAYVIHPYASMFGERDRELAQARLDETIERNQVHLAGVGWSATLIDAAGVAAAALLDAAREAELIVVGSRGAGGFPRLRLGTTSYRVAAHAPAPVAVVPDSPDVDDGSRPLLVGIDDSPVSRRALHWAVEEAARRDTEVLALHSYLLPVDPSPLSALNQTLHEEARERAHDRAVGLVDEVVDATQNPDTVEIRRKVAVGPASGVLLDHAEGRLTVVGTRGQGRFSRAVFGSVSQQVLHHAEQPVVVVP